MPVARNIGQVGDAQGPQAWFQALPLVTRYWFAAALVTTLATNFQIISITQIVFWWDKIYQKVEIWRLLSCFLYIGPFEFNTLISLMLLVQFSERYEKGGPFNTGAGGGTADYVFMLMIMAAAALVSYPLMGMLGLDIPPIFARNLIYGVLYVWSKRNPEGQANIWGIPIPAIYLPFAYVAFTVFLGGSFMDMLHGMAVAHLYYFLAEVVPQVQGRDLIQTPQFLIDTFGIGEYRPEVAGVPPAGGRPGAAAAQQQQQQQRGGGGYNWGGGGQALGR